MWVSEHICTAFKCSQKASCHTNFSEFLFCYLQTQKSLLNSEMPIFLIQWAGFCWSLGPFLLKGGQRPDLSPCVPFRAVQATAPPLGLRQSDGNKADGSEHEGMC